jgi:hypothetical protein
VTLLALLGVIISLRQPQARILGLLIIVFALPYALGMPFFYRYRYPIEPLLLLFAGYAVIAGVQYVAGKMIRLKL